MQCQNCHWWYEFSHGPGVDQGRGCGIFVVDDEVRASYGSLALYGNAQISTPGTFTQGAIICDLCYLQGVKNGTIVPPKGRPDFPLPQGLGNNVWIIGLDFKSFRLLCTFEGWVFYASYHGQFTQRMLFECIGYHEESDIGLEEILTHPEVIKMCESIKKVLT